MASIFRRKYKNARGTSVKCSNYTVAFKDIDGSHRQLPGYSDKRASEELGRQIEQLVSCRTMNIEPDNELAKWAKTLPAPIQDKLLGWGILDARYAGASKKLLEHLADYKAALINGVASKRQRGPATQKHAELVEYRVKEFVRKNNIKRLGDVTPESLGDFITTCRKKLSVQTCNNYVKDIKAFFNWMVYTKRAVTNPVADVRKQSITEGVRCHIRRALEPEEAVQLLSVARSGPVRYGMTGEQRYWLYRVALETGLRSSEIRALTRASFVLDDDAPHIYLAGDDTKNQKPAEPPLRPDTVADLRSFLADLQPGDSVFPTMPIVTDVAYMLRFDLKDAGIASKTSSGVIDFHALRVSCITWLMAAGVDLKTMQEFARHSDIRLTLNVYSKRLKGSMDDAASRLPALGTPSAETVKAFGTTGKPVKMPTAPPTALRTVKTHARGSARPFASIRNGNDGDETQTGRKSPRKPARNRRTVAHRNEREWMGIEPTKCHVNDTSTALKAAEIVSQVVNPQALTENDNDHCSAHCKNQPPNDRNDVLSRLGAGWGALAPEVRAAIEVLLGASESAATGKITKDKA